MNTEMQKYHDKNISNIHKKLMGVRRQAVALESALNRAHHLAKTDSFSNIVEGMFETEHQYIQVVRVRDDGYIELIITSKGDPVEKSNVVRRITHELVHSLLSKGIK